MITAPALANPSLEHNRRRSSTLRLPWSPELACDPTVREVWLIGSRANGTATEDSDWDLLVFSDREPRPVPARYEKVGILHVGPSDRILLEGMSSGHTLDLADFQWLLVSEGRACYLGKRLIEYPEVTAVDAEAPRFERSWLEALKLGPAAKVNAGR